MRLLALVVSAAALATPTQLSTPSASPLLRLVPRPAASPPPLPSAAKFLQAHQRPDGGFAEAGAVSSPGLTAWVCLGLAATGAESGEALRYLRAHEDDPMPATTRALIALAEAALGDGSLAATLPVRSGPTNLVIWTILARRQASLPAPPGLARTLVSRQAASGGWGWAKGVAPDSNDTAVAIEALRAARVSGAPIRRGLSFLRRLRNDDGGFALTRGRPSDAQSTAWAIQAFLAARVRPPDRADAYLRRLRQADGSYRYSIRYATTPVWVTAQVLPAVVRRPFPLR